MPGTEEAPGPLPDPGPRQAVFLDRDGTLIREEDYLADSAAVVLLPGVPGALKLLQEAGFALVVVTNQSGIARGFLTLDDYEVVAQRLDEVLGEEGVRLDATLFCPHGPDAADPCECRKPGTGLHRAAASDLKLDLEGSYFVGDRVRDVLPARELGGQGILVRTGYGVQEEKQVASEVLVFDDLLRAATWIVGQISR